MPAFDDPRIAWVLRHMVLEAADYVLRGRMERFSAIFCDSLPEQGVIHTPDEQAEFDLYLNELFYASTDHMSEEFLFLKADPHQSYLSPADVERFAEMERAAAFLGQAAERLGGSVGVELLRLRSFVDFVETEGGAIYFNEPAT